MAYTEQQILDACTLPPKFTRLRGHQVDAINDILEAFDDGNEVVYLEAPVGSGKTVIAECVRQLLDGGVPGLYVCSDRKLQQQFLDDFPYARVIMGRSNYPTERMGDARDQYGRLLLSAEDCEGKGCYMCLSPQVCPYQMARDEAASSDLAVLNTAYFMREAAGHQSRFGGKARRELVVIDEADVIEDALMGHVEFEVPMWMWRKLRLEMPKKGVRKPTLIAWLRDTADKAKVERDARLFVDAKERRRSIQFEAECARVASELERDMDVDPDALDDDGEAVSAMWLRDYDTKTVKLKPVVVGPYGSRVLWRHGKRFLLMSGTFISPDQRAADTGLVLDYATVHVPMTFPVENRPVVIAPIADITRRATEDDYADLVYAVEQIARRHPRERVLVHTVSKMLAERLVRDCTIDKVDGVARNVCWYTRADDKQRALDDYMSEGNSIMFAQSMDRGVDLPGDACRVVVVAKVPFPSFGDRRIAARVRLPGGQTWYSMQTVATIVQMTGRGVRSDVDHATSYVLDKQFATNVWSKSKRFLPRWWQDAVDVSADVRWLMRKYEGTKHADAAREMEAGV